MQLNTMLLTTMLAGGGALGLLYKLKNIPMTIYNKIKSKLVYTVIIYDMDEMYLAVEDYFFNNHNSKYLNVEAGYDVFDGSLPTTQTNTKEKTSNKKIIQYKQGNNFFMLNYKKKKLFIRKTKEKLEHASDRKSLFCFHFSIAGWRAKKQISELLQDITDRYNIMLEDSRTVFKTWVYSQWILHSRKFVKPLDRIVIKHDVKDLLIKDIDNFINRKEWYREVGIPFKRGYLFYGPPGTGKSTLSFAIASYLKRTVCIMNLNSFAHDAELTYAFSLLPSGAILILEDVDSAFNIREATKDTKISFSCLLNCLDGAMSKEDSIVIMTTNHKEKLDPALLRCGRTDLEFEIGYPGDREISEYLSLFYEQKVKIFGDFEIPMSQVQEICIRCKDSLEDCKKELYELTHKTNGKLVMG